MMFYGDACYYNGFHNIDLGHNFQKISAEISREYDIDLLKIDEVQDHASDDTLITLLDAYWIGMRQIRAGYVLLFLAGNFFILGVMCILAPKEKKKKQDLPKFK